LRAIYEPYFAAACFVLEPNRIQPYWSVGLLSWFTKNWVNHNEDGLSGAVKMKREDVRNNIYKLRKVMDWIRSQGQLPTDEFGQILSVDDLMGWFGLRDCLTPGEQLQIEQELKGLIEAQVAVERMKLAEQLGFMMS
jgi:hypothetical protein